MGGADTRQAPPTYDGRRAITGGSPRRAHWRLIAAALAVGLVGGAIFQVLRLPLAWMLGPMVAVTIAVILGMRARIPSWLESTCYAILGVLLGSAFTVDIFAKALQWATTTAALLLYILVISLTVLVYFRRVIGYDPATAFFASMPGGMAEMTAIGGAMGGDVRTIALTHGARILVVALVIPLGFRFIAGMEPRDVASLGGGLIAIAPLDALVLIAAGLAGAGLGHLCRLPAPFMLGPLIVSAAAHVGGMVSVPPPGLIIAIGQLGVGCAIGCLFAGAETRAILRALRVAVGTATIMLILTLAFAYGLAAVTDWSASALLLAYAPGGITEMTIVGLALGLDVVFVASHHVVRIMFIVLAAPLAGRLMGQNNLPPGPRSPDRSDL